MLRAAGPERVSLDSHDADPASLSDFGAALAASDLAIARDGDSVVEMAAAGRPSLLISYPPATVDHQTAKYLAQDGVGVVISDEDLTAPRLAQEVGKLLGHPARLAAVSRSALGLAPTAGRRRHRHRGAGRGGVPARAIRRRDRRADRR